MVQAPPEITITPRELGKHLRSIRRKKGLSLSEVARGAGLSRRELVAYERGKVPIPESDLWVLAGSCGVDVAELVPSTSTKELTAAASATSVGDTVTQLRRTQEDAGITAYLPTLQKLQALAPGKRIPVKERELEAIATALGSTPRAIDQKLQELLNISPGEAERLRAMILVPANGRGKPRALAAAPTPALAAGPAPVAEAPTAAFTAPTPEPLPVPPPEPVQQIPVAPAAFLDTPLDAPIDSLQGHNVDVFEELARLPEPVPLGDPGAPLPDLLAPQDPFATSPFVATPVAGLPDGTVELVDSAASPMALGHGAPAPADGWSAADAPPIDVAMRQGSSTWDLGEPPLTAPTRSTPDGEGWDTGWQPPTPPEGTDGAPTSFWEGTDDWAPPAETEVLDTEALDTEALDTEIFDTGILDTDGIDIPQSEPIVLGEDTWAGSAWDPNPWTTPETTVVESAATVDASPWATDQWPREPEDQGAWDHRPDPAAVDTGFYVDWGTPETETPPGWDIFVELPAPAEAVTETIEETELEDAVEETFEPTELEATGFIVDAAAWDTGYESFDPDVPLADAPVDVTPFDDTAFHDRQFAPSDTFLDEPVDEQFDAPFEAPVEAIAALAPISWRADGTEIEAPAFETPAFETGTFDVEPEPYVPEAFAVPEAEPTPAPTIEPVVLPSDEQFVTAGSDWQLGNALPLVEVRGQGALVMRRADERWALADVTTSPDFVVEVELDFRSGPGLGVLFRSSVDDEGRMSGYSFDIDPIYDGGGYLVRQWQADRELWNPIARVDGDDPATMYGTLLVRLVVKGEHLSASVNGVEVLTVESLKQASTDRGRDGATGERVGVQAWSSSDLVIDAVRVASL